MLVKCKDEDGKVIAYVEYRLVNKFGHELCIGQYMWIIEAWVHENYKGKKYLVEMFNKEIVKYPWVQWIYWLGQKYDDRMRIYDIRRFKKRWLREMK